MALVAEAAKALMASGTEAGTFVGGALEAYLANGGNLQRQYLKLVKPQSHRTAQVVWRELQEEENGLIRNEGTPEKFPRA